MNRRLDRLEAALQGEDPGVHFVIHVPPPNLSAAEHAAYVQARGARAFTLDLGAAGIREPGA